MLLIYQHKTYNFVMLLTTHLNEYSVINHFEEKNLFLNFFLQISY